MLAIVDNNSAIFHLVTLLVVLLLACIGCLVVAMWVRKWVKDDLPPGRQTGGFTLSDLRQLHKTGQISTEEFERAKEKMVAAARRSMLKTDKPAAADQLPPTALTPDLPPKPPQRGSADAEG